MGWGQESAVPTNPLIPFNAVSSEEGDQKPELGGTLAMELVPLRPGVRRLALRRGGLIANSERVLLDGRELTRGADYRIDEAAGILQLTTDTGTAQSIRVSYRYDPSKPATGRAGSAASMAVMPIAGGVGLALSLGMAERAQDGRVFLTDVYGMNNNMNLGGGASLQGGFFMSERSGTQSQDLFTGATSQADANEGSGQAMIQRLSMGLSGGTMSLEYRAIDSKFNAFDALSAAGLNQGQIDQARKERGLKRMAMVMDGVKLGSMAFGHSMRSVGDAAGSIDWRSTSVKAGSFSATYNAFDVDEGFTRFRDLAEQDRDWLARERGMSREQLDVMLGFAAGSSMAFNSNTVSDQKGAGVDRTSVAVTTPNVSVNWRQQSVSSQFRRFGDLREQDREQLAREQGLTRNQFNFSMKAPAALNYEAFGISEDDGTGYAFRQGSLTYGRLMLNVLSSSSDEGFDRIGSLTGQELQNHVKATVAFLGQGVNPIDQDWGTYARQRGLDRNFWSMSYDFGGGMAIGARSLRYAESDAPTGLSVDAVQLNSKNLDVSASVQTSDAGFKGFRDLTATEQQRLGVEAGFGRTDAAIALRLGGGRQLQFGQMRATDTAGAAARKWLSYNEKGLSIVYRHRDVDSGFSAFQSLFDPERDLLRSLSGQERTELGVEWTINNLLSLKFQGYRGQSDTGEKLFEYGELNGLLMLDPATRLAVRLWRNGLLDDQAAIVDQDLQTITLVRNLGTAGTLTLLNERTRFSGENDTRPDGERSGVAYERNLGQTTLRTERSETRYEDGTRESLASDSLSTPIGKNMGVSVTDTRLRRPGDQPDETRRDYGFWVDLGGGVRLNYKTNRAFSGATGQGTMEAGLTAGQLGDVKVNNAQYNFNRWDGQRYQHSGVVSVANVRPLNWGWMRNVQFHYAVNTNRDWMRWQREDRTMGIGGTVGRIGLGFNYRSQIDPMGQRAIDRVFRVSTDPEGKAPFRADLVYNLRTMPDDRQVMVRDLKLVAGEGQRWSLVHEFKTNPLRDDGNQILGSVATEWRQNKWTVDFNGWKDHKLSMVWEERMNDATRQMVRGAGIDLVLFRNNPSPLKVEYRLNDEAWPNRRSARHWFQLTYDQRPGPNQTFGISLTNEAWQYGRGRTARPNSWGFRLDYSLRLW